VAPFVTVAIHVLDLMLMANKKPVEKDSASSVFVHCECVREEEGGIKVEIIRFEALSHCLLYGFLSAARKKNTQSQYGSGTVSQLVAEEWVT